MSEPAHEKGPEAPAQELEALRRANRELLGKYKEQLKRNKVLESECMDFQAAIAVRQAEAEQMKADCVRSSELEEELAQIRIHGNDGGEEAQRLRIVLGETRSQLRAAEQDLKEKEHVLRERVARLIPPEAAKELPSAMQLLQHTLPAFMDVAVDIFDDEDVSFWIQKAIKSIIVYIKKTEEMREVAEAQRQAAERLLEEGNAKVKQLEVALGTETKARRELEEIAERKRQEARDVAGMSDRDIMAIEEIEATEHYQNLLHKFVVLGNNHDALQGEFEKAAQERLASREDAARALQAQVDTESKTQSFMAAAAADRDAAIAARDQLRHQLDEAESCQLHPAKVAELRAELREAKHECQAIRNANGVLRASVESLRQKFVEAGQHRCGGPHNEKVKFILGACDRSVFTRLYEDAVRRHAKVSEIIHNLNMAERGSLEFIGSEEEFIGLPGYMPLRVRSFLIRSQSAPDIREMMVSNARDLRIRAAEPLFPEPLKLYIPKAMPQRVALDIPVASPILSGRTDSARDICHHMPLQPQAVPTQCVCTEPLAYANLGAEPAGNAFNATASSRGSPGCTLRTPTSKPPDDILLRGCSPVITPGSQASLGSRNADGIARVANPLRPNSAPTPRPSRRRVLDHIATGGHRLQPLAQKRSAAVVPEEMQPAAVNVGPHHDQLLLPSARPKSASKAGSVPPVGRAGTQGHSRRSVGPCRALMVAGPR